MANHNTEPTFLAGDVRNDLYITLVGGDFNHCGRSDKNIEAKVCMADEKGAVLQDVSLFRKLKELSFASNGPLFRRLSRLDQDLEHCPAIRVRCITMKTSRSGARHSRWPYRWRSIARAISSSRSSIDRRMNVSSGLSQPSLNLLCPGSD